MFGYHFLQIWFRYYSQVMVRDSRWLGLHQICSILKELADCRALQELDGGLGFSAGEQGYGA